MKLDTVVNRLFRVPFRLNIEVRQPTVTPRATVLFIHGIGNSSLSWHKVVDKMPEDVKVVAIDLLGFGLSPRPKWAVYDARRQAQSVVKTCRRIGIKGPVLIVGHSLGALVAVEIAKLYPKFASSLVLCSPPFYASQQSKSILPSSEKILQDIYKAIQARPDQFVKISALAAKYGLVNRGFAVSDENVFAYMNALEASILNQTAYKDVRSLKLPIYILYGTLDPVVIKKHLKRLDKEMDNVTLSSVVAGHEVKGLYVYAVTQTVIDLI